jgi:hypothetical protein
MVVTASGFAVFLKMVWVVAHDGYFRSQGRRYILLSKGDLDRLSISKAEREIYEARERHEMVAVE